MTDDKKEKDDKNKLFQKELEKDQEKINSYEMQRQLEIRNKLLLEQVRNRDNFQKNSEIRELRSRLTGIRDDIIESHINKLKQNPPVIRDFSFSSFPSFSSSQSSSSSSNILSTQRIQPTQQPPTILRRNRNRSKSPNKHKKRSRSRSRSKRKSRSRSK